MSNMPMFFAYFTSGQDWLIVGLIVLVLFGGSKIPELAKGVGEGIREFKKSIDGVGDSTGDSNAAKAQTADK